MCTSLTRQVAKKLYAIQTSLPCRTVHGPQAAAGTGIQRLKYRVFIKYCVFSKILKYIPDSDLSRFFLGVYTGSLNGR